MEEQPVSDEMALLFMRAVGYQPVRCVVKRRGKIYDLWADKRSHRKIISRAQLGCMNTVEFVAWLYDLSPLARKLFPNPEVYRNKNA